MAEDRSWQGLYKIIASLNIGLISAAADGSSSLLSGTKGSGNSGLFYFFRIMGVYQPQRTATRVHMPGTKMYFRIYIIKEPFFIQINFR